MSPLCSVPPATQMGIREKGGRKKLFARRGHIFFSSSLPPSGAKKRKRRSCLIPRVLFLLLRAVAGLAKTKAEPASPPFILFLGGENGHRHKRQGGEEKEGTRLPSAMAERRGERERRGKTTNGAMIYHILPPSPPAVVKKREGPRRGGGQTYPPSSSNAAHSNPIQENKTVVVDTHFSPPSLFPATNPIAPRLVSPQSYISYLPIPEDISTVFV